MKLKTKLEYYNHMHLNFLSEDFNNPEATQDSALRKVAQPLTLPFTKEDRNDMIMFKYNYDAREHLGRRDRVYYSLAAPQVGISKRIITFYVPFGRGVVQPFPRSFWINPTYELVQEKVEEVVTFEDVPVQEVKDNTEEGYEMCLSTNMVAKVKRWKRIRYQATLTNGKTVTGEANGLAARIIQHEIDHLDGKLVVDHVPKDQLMTVEEYKQMRKEAWGGKSWIHMVPELRKEHEELKASYPHLFVVKPKKKKKKKKY